eukprot:CAMPEP_0206512488 /NCGR_PEP_ID=MMETSP0324_2-20121206/60920_1 /ASSEMBLY_ACC=CAM_ASM_000836 /TAXON_ID=2866 /ORGANISM="Crypthecodinium cohnii, Strain Seligo" /LENGTH=69 /DNA_ID=CAMNT_0054004477 /DNA_START=280 /DNA_END=486 /DNA_ORIENTATION=-
MCCITASITPEAAQCTAERRRIGKPVATLSSSSSSWSSSSSSSSSSIPTASICFGSLAAGAAVSELQCL